MLKQAPKDQKKMRAKALAKVKSLPLVVEEEVSKVGNKVLNEVVEDIKEKEKKKKWEAEKEGKKTEDLIVYDSS